MGTIADKLKYLADTKDEIREAIEFKNVTVPPDATFREYADLVRSIKNVDDTEGGMVINVVGYGIAVSEANVEIADTTTSASGTIVE